MAQFLQNFADKLPHLAQRMLRGNAPFRVDVREHPALIEKSSTHRKSSRRISGKSESPSLQSGEVFPQTARLEIPQCWLLLSLTGLPTNSSTAFRCRMQYRAKRSPSPLPSLTAFDEEFDGAIQTGPECPFQPKRLRGPY